MHEDSIICNGCHTAIDTYKTKAYPCLRCHKTSFCSHECYERNKKYHAVTCKGSRKALRRRASSGSIKDVIGRELATNATLVEQMYERFRQHWTESAPEPGALVLWMNDVKDLQTLIIQQQQLNVEWFNWTRRTELERHGNRFAELLQMMDRFTNEDAQDGSFLVAAAVGHMVYHFWVRDACPTPR